jgi:hypothetical protein
VERRCAAGFHYLFKQAFIDARNFQILYPIIKDAESRQITQADAQALLAGAGGSLVTSELRLA